MKALIIALDEHVRKALEAMFAERGRSYASVGEEWMRALDDANGHSHIPYDIDVVVNTVTLECLEKHPREHYLEPVSLLAKACESRKLPLIQLSSCQVFDGDTGNNTRHKETSDLKPVSNIGAMFAEMEEILGRHCERHVLLRVGPLFSGAPNNVLTELLEKFQQGGTLRLSNDDKSCPMHTEDLARVVSAMIDQISCGFESWGIYHYTSSDPVSSYQFAETVLAVFSQYAQANAESMALENVKDIDSDWSRPLLNCEKIMNTFGIKQLPWRSYIVPTVKALCQNTIAEESS